MTDDLYREELIEIARHPSFYGALENADLILHETNASCGDELRIYLQFEDHTNPLSSIKVLQWTGIGCIISQASMSYVAEYMQGKTLRDAEKITSDQLQQWLGVDEISMGRIKCLLLGTKALHKGTVQL